MHRLTRALGVRAAIAPAAVCLLAAAAVTTSPAAARAVSAVNAVNAVNIVTVTYPVHGSTHLKAPNTTVSLGPGKLRATANLANGTVTASLSLPSARVSFKEFGLIPVSATTEFIQDGATTGKINLTTGALTSTSKITLKVTSMSVGGLPVLVGKSCESATPAVITVKSQPGFNVLLGGKLAGTYTVTPFAHCGLAGVLTPLINLSITGPGNTITFILGAGKAA